MWKGISKLVGCLLVFWSLWALDYVGYDVGFLIWLK
jgi:hypothetical protein